MAQMKPEFEKGDYVSWKYGTGKATGYVVEKLTEPAKLGSKQFKASPEEPKYKIKSDKSGKMAIRNPETLEKISEGGHEGGAEKVHDHVINGGEDDDDDEESPADDRAEDADDEKLRSDLVVESEGKQGDEEHLRDDLAEQQPSAVEEDDDDDITASRKKHKSEAAVETIVDGEELVNEHADDTNGKEDHDGEAVAVEVKEDTNGKVEEGSLQKMDDLSKDSQEEASLKNLEENVPQPGQFPDLDAV